MFVAMIVGGVVVLGVLAGWLAPLAYVRGARRRSVRPFRRIYPPLRSGPLPMLDTDPDGPRSAPLRPPFREPAPRSDMA